MQRIGLTAGVLMLIVSCPAFSQEFTPYASRTDLFAVAFPGEPKVQETTWKTEYGLTLPARIYSVENRRGRYSATVIDYKDVEKMHEARAS